MIDQRPRERPLFSMISRRRHHMRIGINIFICNKTNQAKQPPLARNKQIKSKRLHGRIVFCHWAMIRVKINADESFWKRYISPSALADTVKLCAPSTFERNIKELSNQRNTKSPFFPAFDNSASNESRRLRWKLRKGAFEGEITRTGLNFSY